MVPENILVTKQHTLMILQMLIILVIFVSSGNIYDAFFVEVLLNALLLQLIPL